MLTNNPPFPQQLFALNNYRALSPRTPASTFAEGLDLTAYSRGLGGLGLPGDLSSQSRFVRAAFVRMNAKSGSGEAESVNQFFHILHSVEQQRGCCELDGGKYEITLYTSCCNADKGIYYYTTYRCGYAPGKPGRHQADPLPAGAGRTNCAAKLILRTKREKSACIVQESMLYCTVHETFHVMAAWIEIEGVLINELV